MAAHQLAVGLLQPGGTVGTDLHHGRGLAGSCRRRPRLAARRRGSRCPFAWLLVHAFLSGPWRGDRGLQNSIAPRAGGSKSALRSMFSVLPLSHSLFLPLQPGITPISAPFPGFIPPPHHRPMVKNQPTRNKRLFSCSLQRTILWPRGYPIPRQGETNETATASVSCNDPDGRHDCRRGPHRCFPCYYAESATGSRAHRRWCADLYVHDVQACRLQVKG